MSLEPSKIAKNAIYLTVATVGQKIIAFVYFVIIARLVGVEGTGKYFFVVSFTTIFSIFIDLGLSSILTRESAKDREKTSEFLNNILGVKSLLAIITYFIVVVAINLLHYPELVRTMVYLSGIVMILDSFHLTFYAVFRGLHNLKYEALGAVIGQAITVVFGIVSLWLGAPIYFLLIALMLGSAFNFIYSLTLLLINAKIRPQLKFNGGILKFLFSIAYPFALAGMFVKVYSYLDSVLLSKMADDLAVGWWSVAYKLTYAFQFIPMAFGASMFPAMSTYYVSNRELLKKTFEQAIFYLAIIAAPIALGIFSLAEPVILKVYGLSYAPSILPLQILIFAIFPIFLNFPVGSLLNAADRQKTNTMNMGISMVINVILNVVLIPHFSLYGAAVAALVSHSVLFAIGLYFADRIVTFDRLFLLKSFVKVIVSAGIMSVIVILLRPYINFIALIPVGGVVYFGFLILLKGIGRSDIANIIKVLKREKTNV